MFSIEKGICLVLWSTAGNLGNSKPRRLTDNSCQAVILVVTDGLTQENVQGIDGELDKRAAKRPALDWHPRNRSALFCRGRNIDVED